MPPAILTSIQVGVPTMRGDSAAADPMNEPWTSGIFKSPVDGPVRVGWINLDGDGQADLDSHGGPEKAVLAYSADHYSFWQMNLGLQTMPFGGFGENLTIAGLTEAAVCIGDVWKIDDVVLEVSQPRNPCWKLARRWRTLDLAARVVRNGRSGWYFRVLAEGTMQAPAPVVLQDRPNPAWTVERASRVLYHAKHDLTLAAELSSLPQLSESWKSTLDERVRRGR